MGAISTGIGLISGLNIQDLVAKLIDLESGASKQIQAQIDGAANVRSLLSTLSLRIAAFNLAASRLGKGQAFTERIATSSSDALSAVASKGAGVGAYTLTPRRLASTHQLISAGYASRAASVAAATTEMRVSPGGFVDDSTKLSLLNGGAGVRAGWIRITDGAGASATVDLSAASTIRDVVDAINAAANVNVEARAAGDALQIVDRSGGAGALLVQNVAGGFAATDLGLTSLSVSGNVYTGQDVYSLGPNFLLDHLRDGNGVRTGVGDDFTVAAGDVSFSVDVSGMRTVGDVVALINNHPGNTGGRIQASIVGDRLQLEDSLGTEDVSVSAVGGSEAARDLGILGVGAGGVLVGQDVLGSFDTVLLSTLRGGSRAIAAVPGTIEINGAAVDLSAATTLQDVLDAINAAGSPGVTASLNAAGNGITIRRTGGDLTIVDVTGNLAEFLNIAGSAGGPEAAIQSGGLDRQYVSENTRLATYGSPAGVPKGKFRITDGNGDSAVVDLTQDSDETIGQVIREINTRGLAVSARINDSGDGILLENTAGTGAILVQEVGGGTTARALGLLRQANDAGNVDGTLQTTIVVEAGTTLDGLVAKLNNSGAGVRADVIHDGSTFSPFRLNLTSTRSGAAGRVLVDAGATNVSFDVASRGRDAVLLLGGGEPGSTGLTLVSGANTFQGIAPGLQVTLRQTSQTPVVVTVAANAASVREAAQAFIDSYNEIRAFFEENARYDPETDARGPLFTDPTARQIERRIAGFASQVFRVDGSDVRTLGDLGILLNADGRLQLDAVAFERALTDRASQVEAFFGASGTGVVAELQRLTDALTSAAGGLATGRIDLLGRTIERQQRALANQEARLKAKEAILYQRFYAMETALAAFQSQQATLTQLASLATGFARR
jgi:flagellar hook-associated protein 2